MIRTILETIAPWLKWWPVLAITVAFAAGLHAGDTRCEAEKARALESQLAGINDELNRLNGIALSAEADRAAIETRNRELQRSLSHEATKTLDACPAGALVLQALNAGRVRPAPGRPAR
jgi:hypothetical protein